MQHCAALLTGSSICTYWNERNWLFFCLLGLIAGFGSNGAIWNEVLVNTYVCSPFIFSDCKFDTYESSTVDCASNKLHVC